MWVCFRRFSENRMYQNHQLYFNHCFPGKPGLATLSQRFSSGTRFIRAGCLSYHPNNDVTALKTLQPVNVNHRLHPFLFNTNYRGNGCCCLCTNICNSCESTRKLLHDMLLFSSTLRHCHICNSQHWKSWHCGVSPFHRSLNNYLSS